MKRSIRGALLLCCALNPLWGGAVQECAQCHESIVKEWESSGHAMAHASANELFMGMVKEVVTTKKSDIASVSKTCNNCHAPVPDTALKSEGVSCSACHRIDAIEHQNKAKPPIGANNFRWMKENVMAGPTGRGDSPYHGIAHRPFMEAKNDTLCMSCHNVMTNKQGVRVCNTGEEYRQTQSGKSCIECHMGEAKPGYVSILSTEKKPIRSHAFMGARNSAILKQSVDMKLAKSGGKLVLTLTNLSGHNFPTGTGVRGAGAVVEFYKGNKRIGSANERLEVEFSGPDAKTVIPPLAHKEVKDTRLKPNEIRSVPLDIPKGATHAVVRVEYRLAKEEIVRKYGLKDPKFTKVHTVSEKRIGF